MRPGIVVLTALVASQASPATAQDGTPAEVANVERITLDVHESGAPQQNVLGVETSSVPRHREVAADAVLQRIDRPLVARRDDQVDAIVDDRWLFDLGLGLGLGGDWLLDARLQLVTAQSGTGLLGQPGGVSSFAPGDVRLRAKWRLLERRPAAPVGLAFQTAVWLPSGTADGFVSDGAPRVEPRIELDTDFGPFVVVLNAGYQIRRLREVSGYRYDDVIRWGGALRLPLWSGFRLDGSIYGSHSPFDSIDRSFTDAVEAMGGVGWEHRGLQLGLAAGGGLTQGVGVPARRVLLAVSYQPFNDADAERYTSQAGRSLGARDTDGDGIPDSRDHCPLEPETYDGYEDDDGCPDLDDDGDQIADLIDACPRQFGVAQKAGCPLSDEDGDGVDDAIDACPEVPEDFDGYQDQDGCPEGPEAAPAPVLAFTQERCEDCAESGQSAWTTETISSRVPDAIYFGTDSTNFEPAEHPLVRHVTRLLKNDTSVVRLVIEGHTDGRGSAEYNRELSRSRAETVRQALLGFGIAEDRVVVDARGETEPLADNATDEGRAFNRRVIFRVERQVRSTRPRDEDEPVDIPEREPVGFSLRDFVYDRRFLLDEKKLRFLEGAALTAQNGWTCGIDDGPKSNRVTLTTGGAPAFEGTLYPGWSAVVELSCERAGEHGTLEIEVELPSFRLEGPHVRGDAVMVPAGGVAAVEVNFSGRAMDLDVEAKPHSTFAVRVGAQSARLRVTDDPDSLTGQMRVSVANRTLLTVPLVRDTRLLPQPIPTSNRWLEVAAGTTLLFDPPVTSASTVVPVVSAVRFTGRVLATEWFSAGLAADIGGTLGVEPNLFSPALGAEAAFHAPLGTMRPFVSTGFLTFFPGLREVRPGIDVSVGTDWEPAPGAGLRFGIRNVVMGDGGDAVYVPGGFLGAYTTFE